MEADIPIPSVKKAKASNNEAVRTSNKQPRRGNATAVAVAVANANSKAAGATNSANIVKPKQSKSRNGCVTCKKKRLKCDETKPLCQQCARRNVPCEGYRKDYKWRSFEDATFFSNNTNNSNRLSVNPKGLNSKAQKGPPDEGIVRNSLRPQVSPPLSTELHPPPLPKHEHTLSPALDLAFASAAHALHSELASDKAGKAEHTNSNNVNNISHGNFYDGLDPYSLPGTATTASASIDDGSAQSQSAGSTFSSISPRLSHLCLPGTDLGSPPDPSEPRPPLSPHPYQPDNKDNTSVSGLSPSNEDQEDFDDEVVREPPFTEAMQQSPTITDAENHDWALQPAPASPLSETSNTSSKSSGLTILAQPKLSAASAEMLALRFDKHTCGILSIRDGPRENPWRSLIWPLAHESQALYHALNSMIAFHGSSDIPALRVEGMRQFTKSIKNLSIELEHMRTDAALATALALAFSEGWDHHTTTGIQHLKGAKTMVNNAVVKHCRGQQLGDLLHHDAARLKFLCNTYVYMDVIARLSSLEKANDFNLAELVAAFNPIMPSLQIDIDPLLGCAVDLFPIIGRVANLIHTVRQTPTNSLQIIGEASELKDQLLHWEMPRFDMFEPPDDSTTRVQHAMMTAEAYRYATLLYLHQAVPEMASDSTSVLAKQVLLQLTNVPIWSRCVIIQIFPLLAAGCEVESDEDRAWVLQRWLSMIHRLKIGNVNRCLDVIQEAWSRRDEYEVDKHEQLSRRYLARRMPADLPRALSMARTTNSMDDASATETNVFNIRDRAGSNSRPMKRRRMTIDSTGPSIPRPSRMGGSTIGDPAVDHIEPPYTVRGKLHWLGVMVDRGWEVFLG